MAMNDVRVEPATAGATLAPDVLEQLAAWWGDFAAKASRRGEEENARVGAVNAMHFARKRDASASSGSRADGA